MKKWSFFALILFLLSSSAFAKSRIAFLEMYDQNGQLVQYEPGGRFVHTALQFDDIGDKWLNAYPREGVAIITLQELEKRGVIADIVEIPQDISMSQVQPYMGIPFDFWYSWNDNALYCSELIGKILKVPTHPMTFNREVWPKHYWKFDGLPGLSPDKLWIWAKEQEKHLPR